MKNFKQPWIYSPLLDWTFILLPPFIALLIVALFPAEFKYDRAFPLIAWVLLILFVDVAHVYATLYRTYFDKEVLQQHGNLLFTIPFIALILGIVSYSITPIFFWRLLAYTAVFHFVRQQYGFMRIYARNEKFNRVSTLIDSSAIYSASLFPIFYWHLHEHKNFNWFVEGDFLYFESALLLGISVGIYVAILAMYVIKESITVYVTGRFNLPKNSLIFGTYLSWFFGIVYFNGDLAFTALNVISHGIPYMALVWVYGKRKTGKAGATGGFSKVIFSRYGILLFLLSIFGFAYLEEGFWDALVWNEHQSVFGFFYLLPKLSDELLLSVVVPLLALPQLVHYIIDGFIWRIRKDDFQWRATVLDERDSGK